MITSGGRRCGKTLAQAQVAAALIKAGHRVVQVNRDGTCSEIVGVPGFDDGRQITEATAPSKACADSAAMASDRR